MILQKIVKRYPDKIPKMKVVKGLIDIMFEDTKLFYLANFIFYVSFYYIPFFMQLYFENPTINRFLLGVCSIYCIYHFGYSIYIIRKIKVYDAGLVLDVVQFVLFGVYCWIRQFHMHSLQPSFDSDRSPQFQLFVSILVSMLIYLQSYAFLYYMRMYEQIGIVV